MTSPFVCSRGHARTAANSRKVVCGDGYARTYCLDCDQEKVEESRSRHAPAPIVDLPGEEWGSIPGYGGAFGASTMGRIRSEERLSPIGRRLQPRIMAQYVAKDGRWRVSLRSPEKKNPTGLQVHVLVLQTFRGERPPGMEGCHGPGGFTDNRLLNLRWDTKRENDLDKVRFHPLYLELELRCAALEAEVAHLRSSAHLP